MFKKSKGFTLIELLIVIAIIGILAALLIPNAMTAMQKAKQKATMKEIVTISTAMVDYLTDNGVSFEGQNGAITQDGLFYKSLCPFYVTTLPVNDAWGNPYEVFTRSAASGICGAAYPDGATFRNDEFVVLSYGRDGVVTAGYTYDPASTADGFYTVNKMSDFNNDLVMWNGSWIVGPITREVGTGG